MYDEDFDVLSNRQDKQPDIRAEAAEEMAQKIRSKKKKKKTTNEEKKQESLPNGNLPPIQSSEKLYIEGFDSDSDNHVNVQGELEISDNEDLPEVEQAKKRLARQQIRDKKKQTVILNEKKNNILAFEKEEDGDEA